MATKETERGRLARERILAQDKLREAEDALRRAEALEILNRLEEDYGIEASRLMTREGKTGGIQFSLTQAWVLLAVLERLSKGECPWEEK